MLTSTYDCEDDVAVNTLEGVYGTGSEHCRRYGNSRVVCLHLANWGSLGKQRLGYFEAIHFSTRS